MTWHSGHSLTGLSALLLATGIARVAEAQAFVPARGESTVTIQYQDSLVLRHLSLHDSKDNGRIQSRGLMFDFSMGLGRRFAASLTVPYIASRYNGTRPHALSGSELAMHPTFTPLDDGKYHSTWQDVRADIRYNLTRNGLVITPFVMTITPSHDYEFLSHAAVGRRVRELQVGVWAARLLDALVPGAFVQGRYAHGFEEEVAGLHRSRDMLTLEGGYFATTNLRVFGIASGQVTHGGIDIHVSPRADYQGEFYVNHDRIQRTNLVSLGGGASLTLSDRFLVGGSVTRTVWGINGHAQAYALSLSTSYSFGPSFRKPVSTSAAAHDSADRKLECHEIVTKATQLSRCVCVK